MARKAIADIRTAALPLQARAIMRSGQRALELLDAQASDPKMDGAYLALNKLVAQYRQGLEEIEQAETLPSFIDVAGSAHDYEAFMVAKETLRPVLKFSRNVNHKQALCVLAGLSADEVDSAETISANFKEEDDKSLPLGTPITQTPKVAQNLGKSTTELNQTAFEDLMPSLTNCVLIAARRNNKTVSLGYSANDVHIPKNYVKFVERKLQALGQFIVDNIAEGRDIRLARGDSQSGQILITATEKDGVVIIDMECKGRGLSRLQKAAVSSEEDAFIQVKCLESANVTIIRVIVDSHISHTLGAKNATRPAQSGSKENVI